MTDDRSKKRVTDETVAQWLRELGDVEADGAFRDRLRSAFVSGEIEASAPRETGAERPAVRPGRRRGRWSPWRWLVPITAAMAVVVVFLFNAGPALEVIDVSGSGAIVVDGHSLTGAGALGASINAGDLVEVPADAALDLEMAGTALYELAGGTRMTMPASPGRWWSQAVECSLFVGEVRFKSGPEFAGRELRVYTPDGMVVVTGTLISVQTDAAGTCVCVLEGVARVGVDVADLEEVTPGMRKVMMRDGTREIIPVKPMHRDGVLDFDARVGERME
jgi:ferric-dicitrate binding protein FerR (iron transport regulator)